MTISLSAIHIYPVKALGGISLAQAVVTSRGLQNDRRFMVIDADHQFLTQREYPKMATVWVEIENDEVISFVDTPEDIRDKYQYFTEANMSKLKSIGYERPFHTLEEGVSDYVKNYLVEERYY